MEYFPTTIRKLSPKAVEIHWNDGKHSTIDTNLLRRACPCASCKELRGDTTHAQPLTGKKSSLKVVEHSSEESTRLNQVWAIGRYAIGCRWDDGHDTGIYPYALLRQLDSALS